MIKPLSVKALSNYKIWIKFSDRVEGEVNLSHLVGKGVFSQWEDINLFQKVKIGNGRSITWNDQIDLCADSLYLKITKKTPGEIFPNLEMEDVNA